jgi:predicted nucleic acid-binding protein
MIKRIYIDTSVFGGYFDKEFEKETKPFFERILKKRIMIIVSEILELELYRAPNYIQDFLNFREWYQMIEIRTPKEIFNYENDDQ